MPGYRKNDQNQSGKKKQQKIDNRPKGNPDTGAIRHRL